MSPAVSAAVCAYCWAMTTLATPVAARLADSVFDGHPAFKRAYTLRQTADTSGL